MGSDNLDHYSIMVGHTMLPPWEDHHVDYQVPTTSLVTISFRGLVTQLSAEAAEPSVQTKSHGTAAQPSDGHMYVCVCHLDPCCRYMSV